MQKKMIVQQTGKYISSFFMSSIFISVYGPSADQVPDPWQVPKPTMKNELLQVPLARELEVKCPSTVGSPSASNSKPSLIISTVSLKVFVFTIKPLGHVTMYLIVRAYTLVFEPETPKSMARP
jgi:hypothetical protein